MHSATKYMHSAYLSAVSAVVLPCDSIVQLTKPTCNFSLFLLRVHSAYGFEDQHKDAVFSAIYIMIAC